MSTAADYRRGVAALLLALAALVPARSGVAQVSSSTSLPATTTATNMTASTTTSTTVATTMTTVPFVTLPYDDPLFTIAPDVTTGPAVTGMSTPATITTLLDLPFSTPFTRVTTTTIELETVAFSTTTTEPATTTTVSPTTTTTVPLQRLEVATVPAPAPLSSDGGALPGAWTALAGLAVAAAALVAWRRLRG